MSAFEFGENEKLSPIALIAKANSVNKDSEKKQIFSTFEALTRRLTLEKVQIMNTMKLKIVDNIMQFAPHLAIRPISDMGVSTTISSKPLVVLIDTSGSMSSSIVSLQLNLKLWINSKLKDGTYNQCTIIFFESLVHGPFYSIDCLNKVHGSGGTNVVPALQILKHTLQGLNCPSDVIFITDGDFNEGKNAYNFGSLQNIENFVMVFPSHTPENTIVDHYAYLPRITPPNTPIYSSGIGKNEAFDEVLNDKLVPSYKVQIERTLYTPICGEYLMLTGLSLFQMNSIVGNILKYTEEEGSMVHNFFSYIMGVYNAMATKGGDLLNTLRSEEMKLLWQLLQPLKKTLQQVNITNVHYPTTSLVYDFLESYEGEIVGKRDARINELKKKGNSKEVAEEIANIKKSFECMKRVDEYERIMIDIEKLKQRGFPSIYVKYNYKPSISSDAFKGFPNLSRQDVLEIYKTIASIGVVYCVNNKIDPDTVELVLDPEGCGLILALRLMTYSKSDENKMTLTATLVSRMMFGFFATQILQGYIHSDDHDKIKLLLWKHVVNFSSHAILFNMTNMTEPSNCAPEWIKILNTISSTTNIKVTYTPPTASLSVWEESNGVWILNQKVLNDMTTKNSALYAYRYIQGFGDRGYAQVTTNHVIKIENNEIDNFILKVSGKEQTWEEWKDFPVRSFVCNDGTNFIVTNGMIVQERINLNVDDFLKANFEAGHRLINKAGIVHPATCYQSGIIKQTVQYWFLESWKLMLNHYKDEIGHLSKYSYPTVTNDKEFEIVKKLIEIALFASPISYDTTKNVQVYPWLVTKCANIFDEKFVNIIFNITNIKDFGKMSGEAQTKVVMELPEESVDLSSINVAPELLILAKRLAEDLRTKFQPIESVTGVGKNGQQKKNADVLISLLETPDFNLDEFLNLKIEDLLSSDDFCCPITGDVFEDPVMFDNHIYERNALLQWLTTSYTSPLTRRKYGDDGKLLQICEPPSLFVTTLKKFKAKK